MKKIIYLLIQLFSLSTFAFEQSVVYRASGASIQEYNEHFRLNTFSQKPIQILNARLSNPELTFHQQNLLQSTLEQANLNPKEASHYFELFLKQTELELMTAALRETSIEILKKLRSLDIKSNFAQKRMNAFDLSKDNSVWPTKQDLLQKEILAFLNQTSNISGGEDLALYINGIRYQPQMQIGYDDQAQWMLVSNQWQPQIYFGTWNEFLSLNHTERKNWVDGDCKKPIFNDLTNFDKDRSAVFSDNCMVSANELVQNHEFQKMQLDTFDTKKTLIWTGALLALSLIAVSASGKTIRFNLK